MTFNPASHTPYQWDNAPATDTPLDATHLEAAEQDLVTYVQTVTQALDTYLALVPTAVKTAAYTASPGDLVPVDTTSGAVTITLPAAPADRSCVAVKMVTKGSTNVVTIQCGGADTYNKVGGLTSRVLNVVGESVRMQYAASTAVWYILATDTPIPQLDLRYDTYGAATTAIGGALLKANNLSDLASASTARTNLGLGSAATQPSSAFDVAGAAAAAQAASAQALVPTAVKTSAYTAAAGDFVPVNTTSGAVTITLPTSPADKTRVGVKMVTQGATNAITILCGGSDTFNKTGGSTTRNLAVLNESVILQYTASSGVWYTQAADSPVPQLDLRYAPLASPTFTGTLGFASASGSGNFTLTGATSIINFNGASSSANGILAASISGDANSRFGLTVGGAMSWGPGNAGYDVALARTGVGALTLTGGLVLTGSVTGMTNVTGTGNIALAASPTFTGTVGFASATGTGNLTLSGGTSQLVLSAQSASTNTAFGIQVSGDTITRLAINASGQVNWGPGNAATDTTLARTGVGALTLTGSLAITGNDVCGLVLPTYSASITPNFQTGRWQTITVTNTTAFTINAPTNPPSSSQTGELTIEVLNSSGGVMGVITWNAVFIFPTGTWTNPANTKHRFARFIWNGANWIATSVASSDY